jgi:hypothetical protein
MVAAASLQNPRRNEMDREQPAIAQRNIASATGGLGAATQQSRIEIISKQVTTALELLDALHNQAQDIADRLFGCEPGNEAQGVPQPGGSRLDELDFMIGSVRNRIEDVAHQVGRLTAL